MLNLIFLLLFSNHIINVKMGFKKVLVKGRDHIHFLLINNP